MWVNPLLQALIDAAQSEQTSRTIRIVCDPCIPSVSDRPCMPFPAGVCDRGPRPFHKRVLSGHGDNRACRLFEVFEGHREEEEEEGQ